MHLPVAFTRHWDIVKRAADVFRVGCTPSNLTTEFSLGVTVEPRVEHGIVDDLLRDHVLEHGRHTIGGNLREPETENTIETTGNERSTAFLRHFTECLVVDDSPIHGEFVFREIPIACAAAICQIQCGAIGDVRTDFLWSYRLCKRQATL